MCFARRIGCSCKFQNPIHRHIISGHSTLESTARFWRSSWPPLLCAFRRTPVVQPAEANGSELRTAWWCGRRWCRRRLRAPPPQNRVQLSHCIHMCTHQSISSCKDYAQKNIEKETAPKKHKHIMLFSNEAPGLHKCTTGFTVKTKSKSKRNKFTLVPLLPGPISHLGRNSQNRVRLVPQLTKPFKWGHSAVLCLVLAEVAST